MSAEDREAVLRERKSSQLPWHSPKHRDLGSGHYHISAACYEHAPIIGLSVARMEECERNLTEVVLERGGKISAWCLLPNHYHLLLESDDILGIVKAIGRFHGRSSYRWNGEEEARGRKVWSNCTERFIRSEPHFWATMNYIHHNPVHHGLVDHWQDWAFSSALRFLVEVGKEEAGRIWREYPVFDYGKGWDDP